MRLKRIIEGPQIDIVDNTYVLLETEEFIQSAVVAEQYFYYGRIDYIRFRKYLKYLADNFWESLDAENRHICIDNYVKPVALSWEATGYTDEQLKSYWIRVVDLEKNCRFQRANRCIEDITWFFTEIESLAAYKQIYQMLEDWKQCEFPELFCFVNSLNITSIFTSEEITAIGVTWDYTSTGFASKTYYTLDRLNLVNEILFND